MIKFDRLEKKHSRPFFTMGLVYSWDTFCPCVSSLEEMCISCVKEMRGPQYGDLQWVLGMHRDNHLHFPNGNSARQDLEGGRKFWRSHLLLARHQHQQQHSDKLKCPHKRGKLGVENYSKKIVSSPKYSLCAICHCWATDLSNWSHF